jgi:hypothetical protein
MLFLKNKDIKFNPINNINIIIPLVIYQTYNNKNLPSKMSENIKNLQNNNPEFKYILYDDDDIKEFIKNNFNNDVLYAFNKLKPGAYKADLFRYCIMYINGGVYLDIKFNTINNFKFIYLMDKEHFVLDAKMWHTNSIYNGLLICLPKNTKMLDCINQIVKNVYNNYYGESTLSPTGPHLLVKYFNSEELSNINMILYCYNNIQYILYNNLIILKEYTEYRSEQISNLHYSNMWNNKNIYY